MFVGNEGGPAASKHNLKCLGLLIYIYRLTPFNDVLSPTSKAPKLSNFKRGGLFQAPIVSPPKSMRSSFLGVDVESTEESSEESIVEPIEEPSEELHRINRGIEESNEELT